jgi:FkbM family methyltransferase
VVRPNVTLNAVAEQNPIARPSRSGIVLKVLIGVYLLIGVILILPANARPYRHVLAVYKYFRGTHGICSLAQSWRAADESERQNSRAAELTARSSVIQHDSDGTDLWNTPDGQWWVPAKSRNAVLYDLSEQDRNIYGTGAGGVQPGDVVLDCGANVGVFTKKALALGASRVIAIEPAPENLEALRKNLAAEIAAGKVTIYAKGVWDKDDTLTMYIDATNSAADSFVRRVGDSGSLQLPLTTIDHLVDELHLNRVDFIKMDIEGAERQAVAGAAGTIRRFHPRMALCVYHVPDDADVIPKAVLAIDPSYQMECGCVHEPEGIAPQVAYFQRG